MPDRRLLGEEAQAPEQGERKNHQPLDEIEQPSHFERGGELREIAVARAPKIGDESAAAEDRNEDGRIQQIGPIELEFGREGIEAGVPAEELLVEAQERHEERYREDADQDGSCIDDPFSMLCDADGVSFGRAHGVCLQKSKHAREEVPVRLLSWRMARQRSAKRPRL